MESEWRYIWSEHNPVYWKIIWRTVLSVGIQVRGDYNSLNKRSEKQRRKGKIQASECTVPKDSKER